MQLGADALGRLAIGQEPGAILAAGSGAFALTGKAAALAMAEAAVVGSFTLAGEAATSQGRLAGAQGAFAETGIAATFAGFLASSLGTFVLSGQPVQFDPAEIAGCGLFGLSGEPSLWSYDLIGGGGEIVAGTFSRGRWRKLQAELAAERQAAWQRRQEARRCRNEQLQAAARAEQQHRSRERARLDAAHAIAADERVFADALAATANAGGARKMARHAALLRALAVAEQADALAKAQDEEEAIALLLAA